MNEQLMLPSPRLPSIPTPEEQEKRVPVYVRVGLFVLLFILGFNISNSYFFSASPLFGIPFLAELTIAPLSGLIGFYSVPAIFFRARYWLEKLIFTAVSEIVSNFWYQQNHRIQEARREKQKAKAKKEEGKFLEEIAKGVLIDTSVLVDGRILEVAKTGFIDSTFIILKPVLHELHLISDSSDNIKRKRGRKGLDTAGDLKKHVKIYTPEQPNTSADVDTDLVKFAKSHNLKLMTLDFNLNKLAKAEGVKVLNLNDLVGALKTMLLPGEDINIKVYEEGKVKNQGIGYLSDGTMIIIEGAKPYVGLEVTAKVSKVLQSSAGRMVFAKYVSDPLPLKTEESEHPQQVN